MLKLILTLLTGLLVKHFITDFLIQTPYQWQNKGKFLHPGGLLHALLTVFGTFLVLVITFGLPPLYTTLYILSVEFVVHYLTDYFKVNINKKYSWGANTHEEFWILLGLDQLIHGLTYIWITYILINSLT